MADIRTDENIKECLEDNSKENTKSDEQKDSAVDTTHLSEIQQADSLSNRKEDTDTDEDIVTEVNESHSASHKQKVILSRKEDDAEDSKSKTDDASNESIESIKKASVQLQQTETSNQIDNNAELVQNSNEKTKLTATERNEDDHQQKDRLSKKMVDSDPNINLTKHDTNHVDTDLDTDITESRDAHLLQIEKIRQGEDDNVLVIDKSDENIVIELNENRNASHKQKEVLMQKDDDAEDLKTKTDDLGSKSIEGIRDENRELIYERVKLTSQMMKERENTGKLNLFISKQ